MSHVSNLTRKKSHHQPQMDLMKAGIHTKSKKPIQQKQVLCNSPMTRGLIVTSWDCLQEPVKNLHNSSARFNSHLAITFQTAKNQIPSLATVMTMWRHRQPSKQLTIKELKQKRQQIMRSTPQMTA